jgi:NADH-quinone oxidoreductase subunit J
MVVYETIFYTLSAIILFSTLMAITRTNLVHAVVYLVLSFFGTAVLFYLLGAPLLAALEVIIYAGAIMVLFLFIIMTMRTQQPSGRTDEESAAILDGTAVATTPVQPSALSAQNRAYRRQWALPSLLGSVCLVAAGFVIFSTTDTRFQLMPAMASPVEFGWFLFKNYWFPVEIISFLLFVALVGALYLGKKEGKAHLDHGEGNQ